MLLNEEIEQGKRCTKCGEWKPFEGFSKNKNYKDGLQTQCKECHKRHNKKYRQENAEQIRKQRKQHYQENAERLKEFSKQYRQENPKRIREYDKKYRQENAEQLEGYRKEYEQENAERLREYRKKKYEQENAERLREYYQENKERINKRNKQYRQSEKGKEVIYRSILKRKSHKYKVNFKSHERKEILERDKWECQSCGIKVHDRSSGDWNTPDKAHIDHITPISKGGNSEPSNLQTLCRTCNLSKHDKVM